MTDYNVGDKVVLRGPMTTNWEYGELAYIIDGPMTVPIFGGREGFYEVKPVDKRKKPIIVYRTRIKLASEFQKDFKLITGYTRHIGLFDSSTTTHYKEVHT